MSVNKPWLIEKYVVTIDFIANFISVKLLAISMDSISPEGIVNLLLDRIVFKEPDSPSIFPIR